MKYNDTIELLKIAAKILIDPMSLSNNTGKSTDFKYSNNLDLNNSMDNSIYAEDKNSNKEINESVPIEESKSYNDNKSNGYDNKQQDTSCETQGVIDSITQELTCVRLQQAIILSEIVGKPRSKTRKKRRF